MEEVIDNLKACLVTSKNGIAEKKINKEYHQLVGEPIPYNAFDFRSLEEFLQAVPGIKRVRRGHEYFLEVIPSQKTSHLSALVRGQKNRSRQIDANKTSRRQEGNQEDPEEELKFLARDLNLNFPVYICLGKKRPIYAQVKVGGRSYYSSPAVAQSLKEARAIAAQQALDNLKKEQELFLLPITQDKTKVLEQMLKLLDSHKYGIWASKFPKCYQNEFQESLPENWMEIVEKCREIKIEKSFDGGIVLIRCDPLKSKASDAPDDSYVAVHVSKVLTTTEIWIQIIGKSPAQDVKLSLYDLEEFSNFKEAQEIIKDFLLEKDLWVQIQSYDSEGECSSVIFYDKPGSDRVNLNNVMSIELLKSCVLEPQLKPERRITDVYITHISQSGDIYVRLRNDHLKYLQIRINSLVKEKIIRNLNEYTVTNVDSLQLYLVKSDDGNWYRAGITQVHKETNEVNVFLVDFGKIMSVNINKLVDLGKCGSTILANFPIQAIKINLHNVQTSFDERKVARLTEIAPVNSHMLVRVVQRPFNGSLPVVEMFKRIHPTNEIVSINNTLICDSQFPANLEKKYNGAIKKKNKQFKGN